MGFGQDVEVSQLLHWWSSVCVQLVAGFSWPLCRRRQGLLSSAMMSWKSSTALWPRPNWKPTNSWNTSLVCIIGELFWCEVVFLTHMEHPLKTECGCLHGGVIENSRARNPLTLCSVHAIVHVQVWVHIPGDPQSVHLRNATTTTPPPISFDQDQSM